MTAPAAGASSMGAAEDTLQLVTFELGGELFGLEILGVQEIIRVPAVTPVPHCPPFVDGVTTLRGKIVPVVDLRARFGMPRTPHTDATRIVVARVGPVRLGLVVDRVIEVTRLDPDAVEPSGAVGGGASDYLMGVGKLESGLVTLVDVGAVGAPLEAAA